MLEVKVLQSDVKAWFSWVSLNQAMWSSAGYCHSVYEWEDRVSSIGSSLTERRDRMVWKKTEMIINRKREIDGTWQK